jgi:hypothetical protein
MGHANASPNSEKLQAQKPEKAKPASTRHKSNSHMKQCCRIPTPDNTCKPAEPRRFRDTPAAQNLRVYSSTHGLRFSAVTPLPMHLPETSCSNQYKTICYYILKPMPMCLNPFDPYL